MMKEPLEVKRFYYYNTAKIVLRMNSDSMVTTSVGNINE